MVHLVASPPLGDLARELHFERLVHRRHQIEHGDRQVLSVLGRRLGQLESGTLGDLLQRRVVRRLLLLVEEVRVLNEMRELLWGPDRSFDLWQRIGREFLIGAQAHRVSKTDGAYDLGPGLNVQIGKPYVTEPLEVLVGRELDALELVELPEEFRYRFLTVTLGAGGTGHIWVHKNLGDLLRPLSHA